MPKLAYVFNRDELAELPYAVIVENWHKAVGREASYSKRKAYHAEFNEAERKILSWWYHNRLYKWYLHTGLPKMQIFKKLETVQLIQRAGNFFASV